MVSMLPATGFLAGNLTTLHKNINLENPACAGSLGRILREATHDMGELGIL